MKNKIYNSLGLSTLKYGVFMKRMYNIFLLKESEQVLVNALEFVCSNRVIGDYYEFGLGAANSFILMNKCSRFLSNKHRWLKQMKFIGFDSFEGLPEIEKIDTFGRWKKGKYKYSKKYFITKLKKHKVDLAKVRLIKGWYSDTLTKETIECKQLKKASIIFIDCDLYMSTKYVMKFINDLLQEGTVIVIDDWALFKLNENRGVQKAFNEWSSKTKHKFVLLCKSYNRVAFVITKVRI